MIGTIWRPLEETIGASRNRANIPLKCWVHTTYIDIVLNVLEIDSVHLKKKIRTFNLLDADTFAERQHVVCFALFFAKHVVFDNSMNSQFACFVFPPITAILGHF